MHRDVILQAVFAVFHGTWSEACCSLLALTKLWLYGISVDSVERLLNFRDTGLLPVSSPVFYYKV